MVGAKAYLSDVEPHKGRFLQLSSLLPFYQVSHRPDLPSNSSLPIAALLLPKPLLRLLKRLIFSIFVVNHYLLYGHSTRSKIGITLCTLLTIVSHIVLFHKWQAENAIEVPCNRSDLQTENLLRWSMRRIR
jgi:hypothetical protein